MAKTCECCEQFESQWQLKDEYKQDKTYKVCSNCLIYLVNLALKPEMYFNLIKNGHKPEEYLIHSDFYDEDGNALQSRFE